MVLIEDAGDCQKLNILLTVAKPDGESVLQMREFPSFCLLYELEVLWPYSIVTKKLFCVPK